MKRPRLLSIGPSRTKADAVEAATAGEDRTAYLMGISQFAEVIGRSRDTVSDWIHKYDCPAKIVGNSGEKILLDLRDVIRWRESWVRQDEASKYARPTRASLRGNPDDPLALPPITAKEQIQEEQLKQ